MLRSFSYNSKRRASFNREKIGIWLLLALKHDPVREREACVPHKSISGLKGGWTDFYKNQGLSCRNPGKS